MRRHRHWRAKRFVLSRHQPFLQTNPLRQRCKADPRWQPFSPRCACSGLPPPIAARPWGRGRHHRLIRLRSDEKPTVSTASVGGLRAVRYRGTPGKLPLRGCAQPAGQVRWRSASRRPRATSRWAVPEAPDSRRRQPGECQTTSESPPFCPSDCIVIKTRPKPWEGFVGGHGMVERK
jgi:hypothetical protein